MDYHSQQRSMFWESMVLSGGHVPSPHNYLMASAITHIYRSKKKHKCQSVEKNWFMSFVCIKAQARKVFDIVNVFDKDNTAETVRTCCRYIKGHLQYANVNLSFQMHKCRNSITGQSSITLQSSSVWIMVTVTAHHCNSKPQLSIAGQCLPLKQHGWGSVCWC